MAKPVIILASSTVWISPLTHARHRADMHNQAVKSDLDAYFQPVSKGTRPKPKNSCPESIVHNTLFSEGRKYGVFVVDEAHYARTNNKLRAGCVELQALARFTVAMTATPIMTSPMVSTCFFTLFVAHVSPRTS